MLDVIDGRGKHAFVNRGEMLLQIPRRHARKIEDY